MARMLLAGEELLKIDLPHGEDSQLYLYFPHDVNMEESDAVTEELVVEVIAEWSRGRTGDGG